MELSSGTQKFTFGEVQDTQYVQYEVNSTELQLPYNPFVFDLQLQVYKSKPNYEQPGTRFDLPRDKKTVFGRKKKIAKQWNDPTSIPVYLNAEIISQKHFSISDNYILKDQGSKHGTYYWIDRSRPLRIQTHDTFLIGKYPMVIVKVSQLPRPFIQFTYQGKTIKLGDSKKLFLIGSNAKCDLIVSTLYQFQVCLNPTTLTIFTNLDEEQASADHGLWLKIRNQRQSGWTVLETGSLILVDPYIFRVSS